MTGPGPPGGARSSHRAFDNVAGLYDAWYDTPRGRALFATELACVEPLVAGLGEPILEIGVGTGRFAKALGVPCGVDPAPRMAAMAASRGVETEVARGEALPYRDASFGGVLLLFTLCFVEKPLDVLREARRVLRSDGALVLGIMPRGTAWADMYAERGRAGHALYSTARFYSLPELGAMLAAAGFRATGFRSTLFGAPDVTPPDGEEHAPEEPRDGRIPGAGFVALAAVKAGCRCG